MRDLICDVKKNILNTDIYKLLAPSLYNPTEERLQSRARKYKEDENIQISAYNDKGEYKGIIVFEIVDNYARILDIAVKPEYQRKGIGSRMLDFIFNKFEVNRITAETDDDAIGFYKKYGFVINDTRIRFDTKRYSIIKERKIFSPELFCDENL